MTWLFPTGHRVQCRLIQCDRIQWHGGSMMQFMAWTCRVDRVTDGNQRSLCSKNFLSRKLQKSYMKTKCELWLYRENVREMLLTPSIEPWKLHKNGSLFLKHTIAASRQARRTLFCEAIPYSRFLLSNSRIKARFWNSNTVDAVCNTIKSALSKSSWHFPLTQVNRSGGGLRKRFLLLFYLSPLLLPPDPQKS